MYRFKGQNLGQWQPNIAPEDVLVDDPLPPPTTNSTSKTSNYCTNFPSGACISSEPGQEANLRTYAKVMCAQQQTKVPQARGVRGGLRGLHGLFGGLGKTCTIYSSDLVISTANAAKWDPCIIQTLPVCKTKPPPQTATKPPVVVLSEPEPEEEEDDDNTSYMVGGILAALVVGGIGYAVFKNRKKGKRKKGRKR